MVETEIVLGASEALLDRPARAGGPGEFGERRAGLTEDEVVGALLGIATMAPDQQMTLEPVRTCPGQWHRGPA